VGRADRAYVQVNGQLIWLGEYGTLESLEPNDIAFGKAERATSAELAPHRTHAQFAMSDFRVRQLLVPLTIITKQITNTRDIGSGTCVDPTPD
jgi:hypothetical protein